MANKNHKLAELYLDRDKCTGVCLELWRVDKIMGSHFVCVQLAQGNALPESRTASNQTRPRFVNPVP